ncbi:DUF2827 family protein [Novosphingobium pokkalii]|uniref:DUF2827 family protein n=1 Tax=Novosphingobium pokkalii TaxID=1770194 RepID=UPI00362D534B
MRIGISIITHAGQNIWNNGIGQHVYHLATLFRHLPFVEAVYLLNCGDQDQPLRASANSVTASRSFASTKPPT